MRKLDKAQETLNRVRNIKLDIRPKLWPTYWIRGLIGQKMAVSQKQPPYLKEMSMGAALVGLTAKGANQGHLTTLASFYPGWETDLHREWMKKTINTNKQIKRDYLAKSLAAWITVLKRPQTADRYITGKLYADAASLAALVSRNQPDDPTYAKLAGEYLEKAVRKGVDPSKILNDVPFRHLKKLKPFQELPDLYSKLWAEQEPPVIEEDSLSLLLKPVLDLDL